MLPNTYPDGFPQNPIEAIDFSYFLSDSEKAEWKEWLKSATPEQQFELVDTLHAMWMENQKEVVPSGFTDISGGRPLTSEPPNIPPQFPTSQPLDQASTPPIPPLPTPPQMINLEKFEETQEAPLPIQPVKPGVEEKARSYKSENEENLMHFGQTKYKPNPILDDDTPTPSEFVFQNQNGSKSSEQNQSQRTAPQIDKQDSSQQKAKASGAPKKLGSDDAQTNSFFNVSRVREAATKQALEEIYNKYLDSREKTFSSEREFQEYHGMFLDKIMHVVVNFEQVADYFESMTQKLLEMNDRLVTQAKDFQELKNIRTSQHTALQDQVDEIRRDVDRLFRELKDIRQDTRHRYEDVTEQMAAFGADAYRQDGILQRLDLLMAKVHKLEQGETGAYPPSSQSIADRIRNGQSGQPKTDSKGENRTNSSTNRPTVDLRGTI